MNKPPVDDLGPPTLEFSATATAHEPLLVGVCQDEQEDAVNPWQDPEIAKLDVRQCWELLSSPNTARLDSLDARIDSAPLVDPSSTCPDRSVGWDAAQPNESTMSRFTALKTMGVGASGVVIQVDDHLLQRKVAIKILRPSLGKPQRWISRFLREARAVASLDHPGIVRVFESGSLEGQPFMVVELVPGPNLSRLTQMSRLPLRQAVWLVQQVALAVHFAHTRGVLHRDLKPSNILLAEAPAGTSEGLGLEPRLTDFGLAKRLDNFQGQGDNATIDSQLVGTVRYMSPEQASGRFADVAIASDVFSLGVILYELLTGRVPFEASSDVGVLNRICHDQPTRPRKLVAELPRDLEAIVLKALEKNPDDRYASADAMAADLQRFLRGAPISASKFSYVRQLKYWVRTHPTRAAAISSVALGFMLAIGLVVTSWLRERGALERELAAKTREQTLRLQADVEKKIALDALNSIFFHLIEKINDGKPIPPQERVELSQRAIEFHEHYTALYPTDRTSRHRLSIAYHHLANSLSVMLRWDEVLAARQETKGLLESLLVEDPDNPLLQFQLGIVHLHMAYPLRVAGREEEGLEQLQRSSEILDALTTSQPQNVDFADAANCVRMQYAVTCSHPDEWIDEALTKTISSSKKLWEDNRERPLLAKHALLAGAALATRLALRGQIAAAQQQLVQVFDLFEVAFRPIADEQWVLSIEQALLRNHAQVLFCSDNQWEQLLVVARRGVEVEQTLSLAANAGVSSEQELIFLKLQSVALEHLGNLEEAQALSQQVSQREKELGLEPIELVGAPAR